MPKIMLIPTCALLGILMAAGCMTMSTPEPHPIIAGSSISHQYGEEILAYMMQVVLGQAGKPKTRKKWASRGLGQDLNFEQIDHIMVNPDGNKTAYIVNDPNILGLSKVLYYYAPEMSQFTGSYGTSLYPCTELISLRLFLLKRLRDNRKLSIQTLINHKKLLTDPEHQPTRKELAATNLTLEETLLLQAVFASKPWLFNSLTNPFLVEAFSKTGILELDPLTTQLIAGARYRDMTCTPTSRKKLNRNSVVIAFFPSITKEFILESSGFRPTREYTVAIENLQNEILKACRRIAGQALNIELGAPEFSNQRLEKRLDQLLSERISFKALNTRPLVIYPENAAEVVRDSCPEADFAVIILGRNVYLSMDIAPEKNFYPQANRLYLDITDLKHSQVSSEAEDIGLFLYTALRPWLQAALSRGEGS